MKRLLALLGPILLAAFSGVAAFGQISNPTIIIVSSDPSGSCSAGLPWQYDISNGNGWLCASVSGGTGTWTQFGSSGSGATSVSNSDGTLTISPTTGSVVASINLAHSNTWTANAASSAAATVLSCSPFAGTGTTASGCLYFNNAVTQPTTFPSSGWYLAINAVNAFGGNFLDFHVNGGAAVYKVSSSGTVTSLVNVSTAYSQQAALNTAGTCAMSTSTTCTATISHTYTTPICVASQSGTAASPVAAECSVTGTTVTITAASSNSSTFAFWVFGNPT